jgi:hypothetical protein
LVHLRMGGNIHGARRLREVKSLCTAQDDLMVAAVKKGVGSENPDFEPLSPWFLDTARSDSIFWPRQWNGTWRSWSANWRISRPSTSRWPLPWLMPWCHGGRQDKAEGAINAVAPKCVAVDEVFHLTSLPIPASHATAEVFIEVPQVSGGIDQLTSEVSGLKVGSWRL